MANASMLMKIIKNHFLQAPPIFLLAPPTFLLAPPTSLLAPPIFLLTSPRERLFGERVVSVSSWSSAPRLHPLLIISSLAPRPRPRPRLGLAAACPRPMGSAAHVRPCGDAPLSRGAITPGD